MIGLQAYKRGARNEKGGRPRSVIAKFPGNRCPEHAIGESKQKKKAASEVPTFCYRVYPNEIGTGDGSEQTVVTPHTRTKCKPHKSSSKSLRAKALLCKEQTLAGKGQE